MDSTALISVVNLCKSYDGIHALRGVSFELRAGEVHALVGENGAGKSTLIKAVTGAVVPDEGTIFVNGKLLQENSPSLAKALGIAAIYQQPALFPELTVAENIALGDERVALWKPVDWRARRKRASDLLANLGAEIDVEAEAGDLNLPQQQLVEIARALGAKAQILIMDEPTASLSEEDTQRLFTIIRQLRSQGVGIIYVSHRLDELFAIADRATVLRDGSSIETRSMSQVTLGELIRLMVGRELSTIFPKKEVHLGETVVELRNMTSSAAGVKNVSLSVRAGEIVGLTGLVGAGRTELARVLFGLYPLDSGQIMLRGSSVVIRNPAHAIEQGIAYLPEDRRRHGVVLEMPVTANTTLASLKKIARFGWMDFARERQITADYVVRFAIKTAAIFSPVSSLSGGNQQKVALSRWLATKPSVLILDEPTQGVDVHAKSEIHRLMGELASQGHAILMISSELPEVIGMSDRIVVMRAGTLVGILDRAEATQQKILTLALGHSVSELHGRQSRDIVN
jgi:rhamnose transport system ATP-binding protein